MHPGRSSKIFNKIAFNGPEFVGSSLGGIGQKLITLFENLGNHPETDSYFFEDCDIAICDLLKIAKFANQSGMSFFEKHLPLLAEAQASDTFKRSKIPGNNGCSARFLRKPIRDKIRSTRKVQKICSTSFILSLRQFWHSLPSDFSSFFKGVPTQKPLLDQKIEEKFSKMGCRNLAAVVKDMSERFNNPPIAFGYKKLNCLDACRIVSKTNNLSPFGDDAYLICPKGDKYFLSSVPLHFVSPPEQIQTALDSAEHCVSLYFESVFDSYFIITPTLKDEDCLVSSLLKSVVLGERDGQCYFVCEWN